MVMQSMRIAYLEALEKGQNDLAKQCWKGLIQLLPQSYNQKRTVTMTYENLLNMVNQRRGHKLDEWHDFCDWVFTLPYAEELACKLVLRPCGLYRGNRDRRGGNRADRGQTEGEAQK